MQVYIEYAIIDNLIINYLLLKTATFSSKVKTKRVYLILSSILGTVVAIVIPLFNLNKVILFIVKIILAVTMVYISGVFLSLKKYLLTLALFMCYTFLCGGLIIGVFYFAGVDYKVYFSINYNSVLPIGISILLTFFVCRGLLVVCMNLTKERAVKSFVRECGLVINNQKILVKGFIDSGNSLYDKRSGLPIIVASKPLFEKIYNENLKRYALSLEFDTVSGTSTMQLYVIDKLMIYNGINVNIINNVLLGVSPTTQNFNGYELLLHPALEI